MASMASDILRAWRSGKSTPAAAYAKTAEDDLALRILFFLRFIEDNAGVLGLAFDRSEHLEDIRRAYGTAFYDEAAFTAHVCDLAVRLRMDEVAFGESMKSISQRTMRQVFDQFDLKAGQLSLATDPEIGRKINEGVRSLGPRSVDSEHVSYFWSCSLASRILDRYLKDIEHPRVCDPMCGYGGSLCLVYENADDPSSFTFCGRDTDADSVAMASMRLLMDGYQGPFDLRQDDTMSVSAEFDGRFDGVICEPPAGRYDAPGALAVSGTFLDVYDEGTGPHRDYEARTVLRAVDLMGERGVAALSLTLRPGFSQTVGKLRRYLVEKNIVEACIEVPREFKGQHADLLLWLLRKGRAADDPILLLNVAGDGVKRGPLHAQMEKELDELGFPYGWIVDAVVEHREIPFASMNVTCDEVLATEDASLRYSTYGSLTNMEDEFDTGSQMIDLLQEYAEVKKRQAAADRRFEKAAKACESFAVGEDGRPDVPSKA